MLSEMEIMYLLLFALAIVWLVVRLKTGQWFPRWIFANNRLSLAQRNSDVIQVTERLVHLSHSHNAYYFENLTAQCLRKIARREGRPSLAPKGYLREWKARRDIPMEYAQLAQHTE